MTAGPRIAVIGRSGQLASALRAVGGAGLKCIGQPEIDYYNLDGLEMAVRACAPDIVLNAAAYTLVDKAETEEVACRHSNIDLPAHLAGACDRLGIPLIHISTDCVFDGTLERPYRESDVARPLGVYGRSKYDGEVAVSQLTERYLNIRVSWVFSEFGRTFPRTMLQLAKSRDTISVVNDQVGYPTHALDLAQALLMIAGACLEQDFSGWGLYHLAGSQATDRANMARTVLSASERLGGPVAEIIGVPTESYPTPAERPLNARLDSQRAKDVFGVEISPWTARLEQTIKKILEEI